MKTQEQIYTELCLDGKTDEELEQTRDTVTNACNACQNDERLQEFNGTLLQYIENEQIRRSQVED
jgi:hypothetical protein